MKTNDNLTTSINETFNKLIEVLSSFTDLNSSPAPKTWTAGQIAEHLIKSWQIILEIFPGSTEEPDREIDKNVDMFKSVFLNFDIKMESPDFILPSNNRHRKEDIIQSLQDIETNILNFVPTHNLELICLDFELPTFGKFTKYEWLWFCLFHTQRHIHQLEKLRV